MGPPRRYSRSGWSRHRTRDATGGSLKSFIYPGGEHSSAGIGDVDIPIDRERPDGGAQDRLQEPEEQSPPDDPGLRVIRRDEPLLAAQARIKITAKTDPRRGSQRDEIPRTVK